MHTAISGDHSQQIPSVVIASHMNGSADTVADHSMGHSCCCCLRALLTADFRQAFRLSFQGTSQALPCILQMLRVFKLSSARTSMGPRDALLL